MESGSLTDGTFGPDAAPVAMNDTLYCGQADTVARVPLVAVFPVQAGEDRLVATVRDADAAVGDLDVHPSFRMVHGAEVNPGRLPEPRVLDGVPDEVVHDPPEHRLVGEDRRKWFHGDLG